MPRKDISLLKSHLGFWLRMVSNRVSLTFAQKVEGEGVTVAEWALLRELFAQESAAPSQIAQAMGMTRGAISKLVDRLEAKVLLTRKSVKSDRRFQDIALTDAGRALVPKLATLADINDAEFFGGLSDADRRELMRILQLIVRQRGLDHVPVS